MNSTPVAPKGGQLMPSGDTRRSIELTDILALRFKCKKCASVLSVSLEQYSKWVERQNAQRHKEKPPLSNCPACDVPWAILDGQGYHLAVSGFVEGLKGLVDGLKTLLAVMDNEDKSPGFSLTLEINGEKQSDSSKE